MSTLSDLTEIIEAFIVGAVDDATISPRYECRIPESELPTFIVLAQGATRERIAARQYNTAWEFLIVMLIEKVAPDKKQQQQEARESAYEYLDIVPDYIAANPMLGDHTKGIVVVSTLPREESVQLTTWGEDTFTGIQFRITVTTSKEVTT